MCRFQWFSQLYIAVLRTCIVSFTFVLRRPLLFLFFKILLRFLGRQLVLYFSLVVPDICYLFFMHVVCCMCSLQINNDDHDDVYTTVHVYAYMYCVPASRTCTQYRYARVNTVLQSYWKLALTHARYQYSLFNRCVTWWRWWWLLWQLLLMQACASWWRCCLTRCRCLATFSCCVSSFSSYLASLASRCGRDFCDSAASCRTSTSQLIGPCMFIQSPKHKKSSHRWFVYLYLTGRPTL